MASIHIHQDIYNFEKKRNLFTARQWAAIVMAIGCGVAMGALNIYALRLPPEIGAVLGLAAMAPFIVVGFVPVQGMPAETFVEMREEMNKRGDALLWRGESAPLVESELNGVYKKKSRRRGFEERDSEEIAEARRRVEARSKGLAPFPGNPLLP